MEDFDKLKAQKDRIVAKEFEKATEDLRTQLTTLTRERDEARGWLNWHITAIIHHERGDDTRIINCCQPASEAYAEIKAQLAAERTRREELETYIASLPGNTRKEG